MSKLKSLNMIFMLLLLVSAFNVEAVTISPDIQFLVENETYSVNQTMDFSSITIDSSYIVFNSTGFYLTSANDIRIMLVYLNDDITGAGDGDKIVEFYANTTSGNVWFNLSGFPVGYDYIVNRSGSIIATPTANSSGFVTFFSNIWSTQCFEIFQLSSNIAPTFSNPSPINLSTGVSISTTSLSVTIEDIEGDFIDWNITSIPDICSSSGTSDINGSKSCSVSGLSYLTTYTWFVNATDGDSWTNESYLFTTEAAPTSDGAPPGGFIGYDYTNGEDNNPPETPNKPSGQIFIEPGVEYTYSSSTFDVDENQIRYRFDWGDGNISEWSDFVDSNTSVSMSYYWSFILVYEIRVIAQDINGLNSSWSCGLNVTVSQADLDKPSVADIYMSGNFSVNKTIVFDASDSFDIDGVIVSYHWDFGDGETGSSISPVHVYKNPGEYIVTLIVTDDNGNTYNKSIIVTIASDLEELESEDKQYELPFNFLMLIFGSAMAVIVCLAIVFRDRIGLFLLQRQIRRIEKLKRKLKK